MGALETLGIFRKKHVDGINIMEFHTIDTMETHISCFKK